MPQLPSAYSSSAQDASPADMRCLVISAPLTSSPSSPSEKLANLAPFSALLLLSFGGPESIPEVMPFLRRVSSGRNIPEERLQEVATHYEGMGGKSPINDHNRALISALETEISRRGLELPVIWGNRNAPPFVDEAFAQAYEHGYDHLITVITSAYSAYSSCRQYREDLAAARQVHDQAHPESSLSLSKIRTFYNHPGFVNAQIRLLREALVQADADTHLVFVTHSIPTAMENTSGLFSAEEPAGYVHQHQELATHIAQEINRESGQNYESSLAYCSRSGPPQMSWLEPDINDHLAQLHAQGVRSVAVIPFGFIADHMEVKFDLDIEARDTAQELGMAYVRVPTAGVAPEFVSGLIDLVIEQAAVERNENPYRPVSCGQPTQTCGSNCCRSRNALPVECPPE